MKRKLPLFIPVLSRVKLIVFTGKKL